MASAAAANGGEGPRADTLSVLLPTAGETALLGACLHQGSRAREAWSRWCLMHDPSSAARRDRLAATRTLMPLLSRSAARNDFELEREVSSYVRAAALREELRAARYAEIVAEALAALRSEETNVHVARGAALAASAYDAWALRHCHDLDLLVSPESLPAVVRALGGIGSVVRSSRLGAMVRHGSGLEICLHARPFEIPYYDASVESLVQPERSITICGVEVATPTPEATFVHVLGHASYSARRRTLRWVTDAWHLADRYRDLDWNDVVARVEAYRLTLPAGVLLRYLYHFGITVPPAVLEQLARGAAGADRVARDVAVGAAYGGPRCGLRDLWRASPSWRGRLGLLQWMVCPSPAYVRSAFPRAPVWMVPACYLYRPARFLASTLAHAPARTTIGARNAS